MLKHSNKKTLMLKEIELCTSFVLALTSFSRKLSIFLVFGNNFENELENIF